VTFRRILTACLLLFVAAGVLTLAGKELGGKPLPAGPSAGISTDGSANARQVVAYYFLGKVRCSSCRKIEEVSRKTIEESFRPELSDGRLRFLVVNVDQPENRHFVEEFRLDSSSLVLVEMRGGKPVEWKSLPDVWTLVEDTPKLEKYVREEVASGLKRI
jgi:hypothetical protein